MPNQQETWEEGRGKVEFDSATFDLTDKEKDWLNMLIEKAFEAPFNKMAVRHMIFRLYERNKKLLASHSQELITKIEGMKKEEIEYEDNDPCGFSYAMENTRINARNRAIDEILALIQSKI